MSPESTALPAVSRIASAAGAMAITSVLLLAVGLGFSAPASAETASQPARRVTRVASAQSDAASSSRGRYLVATSGCNDCHTAGYAENGGKTAPVRLAARHAGGLSRAVGCLVPGKPAR